MLVSTAGPGVADVLVFSRRMLRPPPAAAVGLAGVGAAPLRSRAMFACDWACSDSVVACNGQCGPVSRLGRWKSTFKRVELGLDDDAWRIAPARQKSWLPANALQSSEAR